MEPSLYRLDNRWQSVVRRICRNLGRYTYADVFARLRQYDDGMSRRYAPRGCYIPTARELQQYLKAAEWNVVIDSRDRSNLYEYRIQGVVR